MSSFHFVLLFLFPFWFFTMHSLTFIRLKVLNSNIYLFFYRCTR
jgi:hypothetical protein